MSRGFILKMVGLGDLWLVTNQHSQLAHLISPCLARMQKKMHRLVALHPTLILQLSVKQRFS